VVRDLPPQHTAPPWDHGAGAYHPDVESPPPVDLAAWKQQDYHEWQQAAADADRAFDAEVGEDTLLPLSEAYQPAPPPVYQPMPSTNYFEEEARAQAQGMYYLSKVMSWFRTFSELPWVKRLTGTSEYAAARAANPFPVGDMALGALEQFADDARRPKNLTLWQRIGRIGVKAIESFLTGVASDEALAIGGSTGGIAGGAAEPAGGEILGLPVGIMVYIGSSLYLDEVFWPAFNEKYLDFLGEWQDDTP